MKINYEVVTTVGSVRTKNQDNFYLNGHIKQAEEKKCEKIGSSEEKCQIFAVCDGMGGEASGEIAAEIAVQTLSEYQAERIEYDWKDYIDRANRKICDYQRKHQVHMGTTFAGISVSSSKVVAINVGDSRIYRIRNRELKQLSKDHNEYQTMIKNGIEASEHVMKMAKSHLTQFLGIPDTDFCLEPYIVLDNFVTQGDAYLICSDGLYGVLSDKQILNIVCGDKHENNSICKELVKEAEERGSRDNITAMLVYITANEKYICWTKELVHRIKMIKVYLEKNLRRDNRKGKD